MRTSHSLLFIALCVTATVTCAAQSTATPVRYDDRGLSVYSSFTETHDSSSGWSTGLTSSVQYDFNQHVSWLAGIPIYLAQPLETTTAAGTTQRTSYNGVGDLFTTIALTYDLGPLVYGTALTGTAPTGSTSNGTSTGRDTFTWNNHFERDVWHLTPFAEVGLGNTSPNMMARSNRGQGNQALRLPFTTLGMVSAFRAGSAIGLPHHVDLELSAYDVLPFGNQKIFSREIRRSGSSSGNGNPGRGNGAGRRAIFEQIASQQGSPSLTADNGFSASLSIQPQPRVNFAIEYSHSVHYALDTVAFSVGYRFGHLRGPAADRSR